MRWDSMCWVLRSDGMAVCGTVLFALCGTCGCARSDRVERPPPNVLIHSAGGVTKPAGPGPKSPSAAEVSSEGPNRHGTILPRACLESLKVVDYLADLNSYAEVFNADRSGTIDPARVLPAISKSGLRLDDVNGAIEGDYERTQVEEQLVSRTGPVFVRLTHLGHIYSLPRQYSASTCHFGKQQLTIELSDWYRLTFVREEDSYKLSRVEYMEIEGG